MNSSQAISTSVKDCLPSRSFHQEGVSTIWSIDPCSSFSLGLNSKYNLRKASKPLPRSVSLTIESAVPFVVLTSRWYSERPTRSASSLKFKISISSTWSFARVIKDSHPSTPG